MIKAARRCAQLGWRVHPCHWIAGTGCSCGNPEHVVGGKAGKHPILAAWQHRATTDPTLIDRWWGRSPSANVAIATGPESGVFVLDVDGIEGERSLIALERRHGPMPEIFTMQWTGGGRAGWQAFFAWPAGRHVPSKASQLGHKLGRYPRQGWLRLGAAQRDTGGLSVGDRSITMDDTATAGTRLAR
jgi:Bifunctional DNA primase/polymerase, N-terminal